MTSWGFGWRAAVFAFVVLSLVIVAAGWVAIQFDDQYEHSSMLGRMLVGIFGGLFAAVLFSPLTALISAGIGGVASRYHWRRSDQTEHRVAQSASP